MAFRFKMKFLGILTLIIHGSSIILLGLEHKGNRESNYIKIILSYNPYILYVATVEFQ